MGVMKKKRSHPLSGYWLEASAVTLVLILSVTLGGQLGSQSPATVEANGGLVSAVLGDERGLALGQLPDQRVAKFVLSTSSIDPVAINSIMFRAAGNLTSQISRRTNLAPLTIYVDTKLVGTGSEWAKDYGSLEQVVPLMEPIVLNSSQPVVVDVRADLTKLRDHTFGVELVNVDGPLGQSVISILGPIHKIKAFL